MSDLTAEQIIAEASPAEAKCECPCHAEDWCGSCGHSFEGRVLSPLPDGERRIVLTTVNGEWPRWAIGAGVRIMEGPIMVETLEWPANALRVGLILDALAGEAT